MLGSKVQAAQLQNQSVLFVKLSYAPSTVCVLIDVHYEIQEVKKIEPSFYENTRASVGNNMSRDDQVLVWERL